MTKLIEIEGLFSDYKGEREERECVRKEEEGTGGRRYEREEDKQHRTQYKNELGTVHYIHTYTHRREACQTRN